MNPRKKLFNSFVKLRADATKAGLTLSEANAVLLSEISDCNNDEIAERAGANADLGVSGHSISSPPTLSGHKGEAQATDSAASQPHRTTRGTGTSSTCMIVISVMCVACSVLYLHVYDYFHHAKTFLQENPCLWEANMLLVEISRPVESCQFCEGIASFPTYQDISREEFLEKHAYSGRPALVLGGGTKNWTALESFNYKFFQNLYKRNSDAMASQEDCQFFPYNTEFESFEEFLAMSDERADLKGDQWYVGWSNCDGAVSAELRQHYSPPHFLPEGAESSATDWIFMGGPGLGANIHIDTVDRPSWQAQIRGSKTWTLIPPPECEHACHTIQATMVTGNVIVVDTNKWYHKTDIHPGDISITIGSEYD